MENLRWQLTGELTDPDEAAAAVSALLAGPALHCSVVTTVSAGDLLTSAILSFCCRAISWIFSSFRARTASSFAFLSTGESLAFRLPRKTRGIFHG